MSSCMEMDPLINNQTISFFRPSFPLFNVDLLKQGDFDPRIPDLIPFEKISEMIQSRMNQDIDLNGDFELFKGRENKNYKPNSKIVKSGIRVRISKESGAAPIFGQKKSYFNQLYLKRTGKKTFKKISLPKYHLSENSSPNKRAKDSLKREVEEAYNFPSLASILEGESSDNETEFPVREIRQNQTRIETDDNLNSVLQFDLFGKMSTQQDFSLDKNGSFEKVNSFGCDLSLITTLLSETNQLQSIRAWNKKVKENPLEIHENFHSFSIYTNMRNKKMGSFDLTLEQGNSNNLYTGNNTPLEIPLEENGALGLNSSKVTLLFNS